ncbi:hypothetical protein Cflav_PD5645 [Pedosphaera parvula Ellin514]|uniref:Uncharacterized protein n=1 Tax=Pedosphaera parvula (strain Ellin514) TaxID=320771 RepID=B9XAH5_PEDPL|nr:hypothetical protein Cflav_PD5645 [Pedosphaera parvula Ellin514]
MNSQRISSESNSIGGMANLQKLNDQDGDKKSYEK